MTTTICIRGAKGGVGTSTVIAGLAVAAAEQGQRVLILGDRDIPAIFGACFDEARDLAPNIVSVNPDGPLSPAAYGQPLDYFDLVFTSDPDFPSDLSVLVTRGCYLALRRAVKDDYTNRCDGVVLLNEEQRALGRGDVEDVLGLRVLAEIAVRPVTARAVDAGVFMQRNTIARESIRILDALSLDFLNADGSLR